MQFARYKCDGGVPKWGVRDGETVHSLSGLPAGEPTLEDLANPSYRQSVADTLSAGAPDSDAAAEDVSFLAPVPRPGKIVCVALNYRNHAEEGGRDVPESPVLFSKAPTAVANPNDPMGPVIRSLDGFDAGDAGLELTVNGETRQGSSTRELVFDVPDLVAFISRAMTLRPGDVVATGTPAGVDNFYDPPAFLDPGDSVEATVEGIGTLANGVAAE